MLMYETSDFKEFIYLVIPNRTEKSLAQIAQGGASGHVEHSNKVRLNSAVGCGNTRAVPQQRNLSCWVLRWESLEAESLPLTYQHRAADVIPGERVRAELHQGR